MTIRGGGLTHRKIDAEESYWRRREHSPDPSSPTHRPRRQPSCGPKASSRKPNCGFMPKRPAEFVATAAGELGLVKGGRAIVHYDEVEKDRWHGMLTYIAEERGYKSGWIAHKFKE